MVTRGGPRMSDSRPFDPSPDQVLLAIGDRAPVRKLLLLGCACWRRLGHLIPSPYLRAALEAAEKAADLPDPDQAMEALRRQLWGVVEPAEAPRSAQQARQ